VLKNIKMDKKLKFLKIMSLVIKITAWISLLMGFVSGVTIMMGKVVDYPFWIGAILIIFYGFLFLFFYTVATLADILIEIKKEED